MIPGTIARRNSQSVKADASNINSTSANDFVEDATDTDQQIPEATPLEQVMPKSNSPISRRDYLRSLVPSAGDRLVRGLRAVGNLQRDLFGN